MKQHFLVMVEQFQRIFKLPFLNQLQNSEDGYPEIKSNLVKICWACPSLSSPPHLSLHQSFSQTNNLVLDLIIGQGILRICLLENFFTEVCFGKNRFFSFSMLLNVI